MSFRDDARDGAAAVGVGFGAIVGFLIVLGLLVAGITAIGLGISWYATPAQVSIENKTFHESQAYQDGMARDLEEMRMSYLDASDVKKDAIRATVRARFSGFRADRLPESDQAFLAEMMR